MGAVGQRTVSRAATSCMRRQWDPKWGAVQANFATLAPIHMACARCCAWSVISRWPRMRQLNATKQALLAP